MFTLFLNGSVYAPAPLTPQMCYKKAKVFLKPLMEILRYEVYFNKPASDTHSKGKTNLNVLLNSTFSDKGRSKTVCG